MLAPKTTPLDHFLLSDTLGCIDVAEKVPVCSAVSFSTTVFKKYYLLELKELKQLNDNFFQHKTQKLKNHDTYPFHRSRLN